MASRPLIAAFVACLLAPRCAAARQRPQVPVRVAWTYEGVPAGIRLFELKSGSWPVWQTEVVARLEQAPLGAEVPGSTVLLLPGQTKRIALVYENAGRGTIDFFAAPHSITPGRDALGFKFRCLCTNHVYKIPPGHWWYRVVELRLDREFAGARLEVSHELVAVEPARGELFRQGIR